MVSIVQCSNSSLTVLCMRSSVSTSTAAVASSIISTRDFRSSALARHTSCLCPTLYTYTHIYKHIHTHIHKHTYTHKHVTYVAVLSLGTPAVSVKHIHTHIYIHTQTHVYIHTHTHDLHSSA